MILNEKDISHIISDEIGQDHELVKKIFLSSIKIMRNLWEEGYELHLGTLAKFGYRPGKLRSKGNGIDEKGILKYKYYLYVVPDLYMRRAYPKFPIEIKARFKDTKEASLISMQEKKAKKERQNDLYIQDRYR